MKRAARGSKLRYSSDSERGSELDKPVSFLFFPPLLSVFSIEMKFLFDSLERRSRAGPSVNHVKKQRDRSITDRSASVTSRVDARVIRAPS